MFEALKDLVSRPELFSGFDTSALWTDPHVARQMLSLHLCDETALASRPSVEIDRMAAWIDRELGLDGKHVLDLGCGPGLYASRFHAAGARVTGIDLSATSVAHAKEQGCPGAEFRVGDYLQLGLPSADIVTLIYGDVCAMPPWARQRLFLKVGAALPDGGAFLLDAFPTAQFERLREGMEIAINLDGGFWAPGDYVGLRSTFLYKECSTALDRYLIVEPSRTRSICNWLEYMTPSRLSAELEQTGFVSSLALEAVSGGPWRSDDKPFALIARKPEHDSRLKSVRFER